MTMKIRWESVLGFDGRYEVSTAGQVRSLLGRGRILRPAPVNGYPVVSLHKNLCQKSYPVHKLVLEAFKGPCPNGMQARHKDGDRLNPSLSNLQWGTQSQNEADKIQHGTASKFSADDIEKLNDLRAKGLSQREIGGRLGMSQTYVRMLLRGEPLWLSSLSGA